MSDADDTLGQDEIEELLRQAAGGGGDADETASEESTPEQGEQAGNGESDEAAAPSPSSAPPPTATPETPGPAATGGAGSGSGQLDPDVQYLIDQADEALRSVDQPNDTDLEGLAPFELRQLTGTPANSERASLELLRDVELDLRIELGRTHMYLEDVLQLRKGSVVPLDKLAGDPVDIFVNGRLVARGEVLVLNDNFCVRIAELISGDDGD